ncbi:DUF6417 family protein [Streptomyces griseosporeus]|uniref:DUF6417 family protein n=1 Tax=Streptomyces griseosporeus TaxID=1910 RepID=UPI003F4F20A3
MSLTADHLYLAPAAGLGVQVRAAVHDRELGRWLLCLTGEQMDSVAYGLWLHGMTRSVAEANRFGASTASSTGPPRTRHAPAQKTSAEALPLQGLRLPSPHTDSDRRQPTTPTDALRKRRRPPSAITPIRSAAHALSNPTRTREPPRQRERPLSRPSPSAIRPAAGASGGRALPAAAGQPSRQRPGHGPPPSDCPSCQHPPEGGQGTGVAGQAVLVPDPARGRRHAR